MFTFLMLVFSQKIELAITLQELDNIIEEASSHEEISNKEYEFLYAMALEKAQKWQEGENE